MINDPATEHSTTVSSNPAATNAAAAATTTSATATTTAAPAHGRNGQAQSGRIVAKGWMGFGHTIRYKTEIFYFVHANLCRFVFKLATMGKLSIEIFLIKRK